MSMKMMTPALVLCLGMACLAAIPAASDPSEPDLASLPKGRLLVAPGGEGAAGAVHRSWSPPPSLRALLMGAEGTGSGGETPGRPLTDRPSTSAVGDALTLSLDDGFATPVDEAWEATLRPRADAGGPDDWVAVRFPLQGLAIGPPVRVDEVLVGLENLHGRAVWPEIELRLEDAAAPLDPRGGSAGVSVTDFDAAAALPVPPAGATRPDVFERLAVGMPALEVPDSWLSDGGFDDAFERPTQPLDTIQSDWLECEGPACGASQDFRLLADGSPECAGFASACVRRVAGGDAGLAVKIQDASVFATRPALDNDQRVSVRLDLSDPSATRAGLALRMAPAGSYFTYYRVEYVKGSDQIEVHAVDEAGAASAVGGPIAVSNPSDTPRLTVEVTGHRPSVDLRVWVDGVEAGAVSDSSFRYAGPNAGLSASDGGSSGEMFDDFVLERRPDLFVNIRFPEGGWEALPLDISADSVLSDAVLLSTDGASFAPRATPTASCLNPGNPFVQLEITDHVAGDRLFVNEAHLVTLGLDCPTCPMGRNRCVENRSFLDLYLPVATVGEDLTITSAWWNEHLAADDALTLEAYVFDRPCANPNGSLVMQQSVQVDPDPGQVGAQAELRSIGIATFAPAAPGTHCLAVVESHAGGDGNPLPSFIWRDVQVFDGGCVPKSGSNLDPSSFRVAKDPDDPLNTVLSWARVDPAQFPEDVNLHVWQAQAFDPAVLPFHELAPILTTILGPDPPIVAERRIPAPSSGLPLWMAVFETDGCPTGNSILP